jgi:CBS domain containing-hemolysin-like protein
MRKHLVVPETKPLTQMLEEFQRGKSHMALVVDEFGTIVGLLTVEDVLEQIVGDIEDEHDVKVDRPMQETAEFEVDGATKIRDLEADYGIELPTDAGFETLAGFLLYRFGVIPQPGDSVQHNGRRYTVVEMQGKRIAKVWIEKVEPPGDNAARP